MLKLLWKTKLHRSRKEVCRDPVMLGGVRGTSCKSWFHVEKEGATVHRNCVSACASTCLCACACVCVCACLSVCVCVSTCVHMCVCVHLRVHTRVRLCVLVSPCVVTYFPALPEEGGWEQWRSPQVHLAPRSSFLSSLLWEKRSDSRAGAGKGLEA